MIRYNQRISLDADSTVPTSTEGRCYLLFFCQFGGQEDAEFDSFGEAKATGVYEMYYIELATGLRRGELLGLKWRDSDWKNGIIKVRRQVARVDGQIVEAPLKNKELLPHRDHLTASDRSSETAERENQR